MNFKSTMDSPERELKTCDLPVHDPVWRQLRAEIEQEVELVESRIQLGDHWLTWLRVGNPDVLLELAVAGHSTEAEQFDPFWAATWRAAQGLDRFLASLKLNGVRVLELGCGSGQAGVAAAFRGAEVLATDTVDLALRVARLNAWPLGAQIRFQKLNWNRPEDLTEGFPIIIGSDLVYDPDLFTSLEACVRWHLAPGGTLYLSEPHRHSGDKFSQWIRLAGWHAVEHDIDLGDGRIPIRVFACQLRK